MIFSFLVDQRCWRSAEFLILQTTLFVKAMGGLVSLVGAVVHWAPLAADGTEVLGDPVIYLAPWWLVLFRTLSHLPLSQDRSLSLPQIKSPVQV